MRLTGCDDLQAAVACVDALRESVPSLRGPELIEAVCGIEVLTRKTHAVMLELLAGLDAAKVAGAQGFGTTSRLLSAVLGLSAGQARARVRDAEQLATRRSLTGEPLPARLPATAAASASGAIGTGQLRMITEVMAALPATVSPEDQDRAEATLAEHAQNFDPARLRVIAKRIVDQLDPDGPAPRDELDDPCPAVGELHIRDRRDGGITLDGWLDALHGTAFRGLIEQLAQPRPPAEDIPDPRTTAQRNADALIEICDLARGNDQTSTAGGEPPHITVTVDYDTLIEQLSGATLDYGRHLSAAQTRLAACDTKIIPVVLGGDSEPSDVGHAMRTTPPGIRRALIARDHHQSSAASVWSCHVMPPVRSSDLPGSRGDEVVGWNTAGPGAIGIIPGPAVISVRPPRRSGGSPRDGRGLQWSSGRVGLNRGQHVGVIRITGWCPPRCRGMARRRALTRGPADPAAVPHRAGAATDSPCRAPDSGATATRTPPQGAGRTGSDPADQSNGPAAARTPWRTP